MTNPSEMTGRQFKAIREKLELTPLQFGRALGYRGLRATVRVQVYHYEIEQRTIPPYLARLARMFQQFGVPKSFIPNEPGE